MSTGETKETTTATTALDMDDGGGHDELSLLASRLVSHHKRVSLLRRIFSFHETRNPKDYINLRSSSTLFHSVLRPPPLWTSFPCSNHATLKSLVRRLEELRGDEKSSGNVPSVLLIEEGDYVAENIRVNFPLSMYGAGRGKTTLVGSDLQINGKKSNGIVEIGDLTLRPIPFDGSESRKVMVANGLNAYRGMNLMLKRVSIVESWAAGMLAFDVDVSCDDLQVIGCHSNGVCANSGATITLSGEGTSIQRNVTSAYSWQSNGDYGLKTCTSSDKILLVAPLTKEQISTNNGGGGNWGGLGTIEQVDNDGIVLQILYKYK
jgi:hypothetical protein